MLLRKTVALQTVRRGAVVPLVAICLVAVLAFTALAIDGGLLLCDRRNIQEAADAAALAAAIDLYNNSATYNGLDGSGSAATSAKKTAADNGYTDGTNNVTVKVNIPPLSGPYTGKASYAEVIITMQQQRYFSTLIGTGNIPVKARAVAIGAAPGTEGNGILVLKASGSNTMQASNNGNINVTGGNIVVNSSDKDAINISHSGNIQADDIKAHGPAESPNPGGYSSSTGRVIVNNSPYKVQAGASVVGDPLSTLAAPSTTGLANYGSVSLNVSGTNPVPQGTFTYGKSTSTTAFTLYPGNYSGDFTINDGNASHVYTLSSGVYYFSGNVTFSNFAGTCTDAGLGVCLFITNGKGLTLSSGGTLSLSTISSGTYANYPVIFLDHGDSANVTLSGAGSITATGVLYFPSTNMLTLSNTGNINLTGNLITYAMNLSNTGNLNVTYPGPAPHSAGTLYLVE